MGLKKLSKFLMKNSRKAFCRLEYLTKSRFWNCHTPALLTAEDFLFFCDLYLQFIALINLCNKWIYLRLFMKVAASKFNISETLLCICMVYI